MAAQRKQPNIGKVVDNILTKAAQTVDSNRQDEYGDPVENWVATALIATIAQRKSITPEDVVQTMCGAKMVRAGRSHKEDTNIDQAGYAEIRERVQKAFADGTVQKIVEKLLGGWVKFDQPSTPTGEECQVVRIECLPNRIEYTIAMRYGKALHVHKLGKVLRVSE
jgi:hypothetical protein